MNSKIDIFENSASWVSTFGLMTASDNLVPEYIANQEAVSMLVSVPEYSIDDKLTITGNWDFTNYTNLVFHVWSRNKSSGIHRTKDDCSYSIAFGTDVFYFRTFEGFTHETIGVENITIFTEITITCLHVDIDYLVLSAMVIEEPEVPLDIFDAIGVELDRLFEVKFGQGQGLVVDTGTLNILAGDVMIPLNAGFVGRYSVIRVGSGATLETHQLDERSDTSFSLSNLYDGTSFLYDHTAEPIWLLFPARSGIGSSEIEIQLPGYSIWGMAPEPVDRSNELDTHLDSFTDTTVGVRPDGRLMRFPILLDCEARSYEILAQMSRFCRQLMDSHYLWINGRKNDIEWTESGVELEPTDSYDIVPKVQYTLWVEIKEEL